MGLDDDPRWHAWYAQARLHAQLLDAIGDEMERRTGLPAAWFEVLACLKGEGRQRMNELAERVLVSRGGATRIVARMEEEGLVVREIPPTDRRATYAVITDKGRAAIERALPVHLELVEEYFGRHLEAAEVDVLLAVADRIGAAHGWAITPAR